MVKMSEPLPKPLVDKEKDGWQFFLLPDIVDSNSEKKLSQKYEIAQRLSERGWVLMKNENVTFKKIQIKNDQMKSDADSLAGYILNEIEELAIKNKIISPGMVYDGDRIVCKGNLEGRYIFDVDLSEVSAFSKADLNQRLIAAFKEDPIQLHGIFEDIGYIVEVQPFLIEDQEIDTPEKTFRFEIKWQDLILGD